MRKLTLLFLLLFLTGCNLKFNSQPKSQVLARFDGVQVTEQDFLNKVKTLPRSLQNVVMNRKQDLIQDMAAEHFLVKEAERQGVAKDPEVRDLIQVARKKIITAKLIDKEVDRQLSLKPEEAADYYQLHKEEFMTPLLLRASHILVKTEQEAQAIKSSLDQGGDFEETARQRSLDATAVRGGDLGFFQKGQFVPEFEAAVFDMKKGEVRGPVRSPFGYHIIKLNDRVEPRLREFKSVKNSVEERLIGEKRSKTFKDYVEKLKGNRKIVIDEQALDRVKWAAG